MGNYKKKLKNLWNIIGEKSLDLQVKYFKEKNQKNL